jgi:hypothetical protein
MEVLGFRPLLASFGLAVWGIINKIAHTIKISAQPQRRRKKVRQYIVFSAKLPVK